MKKKKIILYICSILITGGGYERQLYLYVIYMCVCDLKVRFTGQLPKMLCIKKPNANPCSCWFVCRGPPCIALPGTGAIIKLKWPCVCVMSVYVCMSMCMHQLIVESDSNVGNKKKTVTNLRSLNGRRTIM